MKRELARWMIWVLLGGVGAGVVFSCGEESGTDCLCSCPCLDGDGEAGCGADDPAEAEEERETGETAETPEAEPDSAESPEEEEEAEERPRIPDLDETWTDPSTGYVWMKNPYPVYIFLQSAEAFCASYNNGGHWDWRVPTLEELQSLIRGCPETNPDQETLCGLGNGRYEYGWLKKDCGCEEGFGPDHGCYWPEEIDGACDAYWSNSIYLIHPVWPNEDAPTEPGGWMVDFNYGRPNQTRALIYFTRALVRCMRGPVELEPSE